MNIGIGITKTIVKRDKNSAVFGHIGSNILNTNHKNTFNQLEIGDFQSPLQLKQYDHIRYLGNRP